jgi:hypothetical protein
LRQAKAQMMKKGNVAMAAYYVLPDGDVKRERIEDPALIESAEARAIIFESFRARAKELSAEAVIWVSDIWYLDSPSDVYRQRIEELGGGRTFRQLVDDYGVVKTAALGYGVAYEAVNVVLQTADWKYILIALYERRGADQSHISFLREFVLTDTETSPAHPVGRGVSMFHPEEE